MELTVLKDFTTFIMTVRKNASSQAPVHVILENWIPNLLVPGHDEKG